MRLPKITLSILFSAVLLAQTGGTGIAPEILLQPLRDAWPTYNGDYTGRRYSALDQINKSNVKNLTLAWATRLSAGMGGPGGRGGRGGGRGGSLIVGGEGPGDIQVG